MNDKKITRNKPEMAARILATAREVMRETDALTMKVHCVARAGGFSTGIIYLHYTNKSTLVARVLEAELRDILDRFPVEGFGFYRELVSAVYDWADRNPTMAQSLLLSTVGFIHDAQPKAVNDLAEVVDSLMLSSDWRGLLGRISGDGITRNLVRRTGTEVAA